MHPNAKANFGFALTVFFVNIGLWMQLISKVRAGGGTSGEGKKGIPPHILQMLQNRWKVSIEDKVGFKSYDEMRKAVAEL